MPIATAAAALIAAIPAGWASTRAARRFSGTAALSSWILVAGDLVVAAVAAMTAPSPLELAIATGLGWSLALLACVDVLAYRLPDLLTLPLVALGLAIGPWRVGDPWLAHLIGAVAGYGVLAALGWSYRRWRGREGLGLGDAKLLAAAGAWLGWSALPNVVLVACGGGFAWAALAMLRGGAAARSRPIPFGLPLAVAFWAVWQLGVAQRV